LPPALLEMLAEALRARQLDHALSGRARSCHVDPRTRGLRLGRYVGGWRPNP
jgi:hypothetical protein